MSSTFEASYDSDTKHHEFVQEVSRIYRHQTNEISVGYQNEISLLRNEMGKLRLDLESAVVELNKAHIERDAVSAELCREKEQVIRLNAALGAAAHKHELVKTERDVLVKEVRVLDGQKKRWAAEKEQLVVKIEKLESAHRKSARHARLIYDVAKQVLNDADNKNVETGELQIPQAPNDESATSDDLSPEHVSSGTKRTHDEFVKKRVKTDSKNYQRCSTEQLQRAPSGAAVRSPSTNSTKSSSDKLRKFVKLDNYSEKYQCAECGVDIALGADFDFAARKTPAYNEELKIDAVGMFDAVVNVECVYNQDNDSGLAAEIRCQKCETALGWLLDQAQQECQRASGGKFEILLKNLVHIEQL